MKWGNVGIYIGIWSANFLRLFRRDTQNCAVKGVIDEIMRQQRQQNKSPISNSADSLYGKFPPVYLDLQITTHKYVWAGFFSLFYLFVLFYLCDEVWWDWVVCELNIYILSKRWYYFVTLMLFSEQFPMVCNKHNFLTRQQTMHPK